jgi:hypothetical protein
MRLSPDCTQSCRAGTRICGLLLIGWIDGLFGEGLERCFGRISARNGILARCYSVTETVLHDAVLKRVERDDCEPSSRGQEEQRLCQKMVERLEFAIDRHADGLKYLGKEIASCLLSVGLKHGIFQSTGGAYGIRFATGDDDIDKLVCETDFAEFLEDGDERYLVERCQKHGRGLAACAVEAHVERSIGTEAESAGRIVQMRRTQAQISNDDIEFPAVFRQATGQLRKICMNEERAVAECGQMFLRIPEIVRIGIKCCQCSRFSGGGEQSRSVPAEAERDIQNAVALLGGEECHGFRQKD